MTVESIRDFLERFKAKVSYVTPSQTPEQIAQMLGYWHPPVGFIVDDQNLFDLFEDCLVAHHGYIDPMWLDTTCRESREHLRWHQQPTEAPAPLPEPAPAQPKLEGRDSLGDGATSVEKPISSVVAPETPRHALKDAQDYVFKDRSLKNALDKLREECRKESFETIDGRSILNHSKASQLFEQRKVKIEEEFAPKKNKNESLQRIAEQAHDEAFRSGRCTYREILDYVNAAIAAKGKS